MNACGSPTDTPSGRGTSQPGMVPRSGLHAQSTVPCVQGTGGILEWVARACSEFPEQAAIEGSDRQLSYAALNARANQVADCLTASRIGPGSVVAVIVPDRIEIISVLLGVFRAGCVFVPLEADSPPERLRQLLARLSPDALVVGAELRGRGSVLCDSLLKSCRAVVTVAAGRPPEIHGQVEPAGEPPSSFSNGAEAVPAGRQDMAYIYYTSGSTGQPKGIAGTLEGLSHFINWETKTFSIGPGWRVSQFTVPTFDPFFRDVFLPLCTGGTICIPPDVPFTLSPKALMDWIDGQRVNLIHCVPSLFTMMLDAEPSAQQCQALRYVLLAGEVLQASHVSRWRKTFGDRIRLVNLYGSTETTMVKLFHIVKEDDLKRGFIPIGRPMDGAEALLLDAQGMVCPPGTVGEIHVRTRFLTLGYYKDPAATKKAFLRDACGQDENVRIYKTGDLAVLLEDGSYRLLGRMDDQVKIRGVRVEPDEVAAVLSQYSLVRSCVVIARTTAQRETILVAYVVPATRDPISMPELRTFLRQHLPPEMMPSAYVCLEKLPLTAHGKVDKAALPAPAPGRSALLGDLVPPRTPTEAMLAAMWCDLLGLSEVGIHDDFLHLGGHSVIAAQLAARVRSQLGTDIPVRTVFDRPTIEKLADYIAHGAMQDVSATRGMGPLRSPEPASSETGEVDDGLEPSDRTRPDGRKGLA